MIIAVKFRAYMSVSQLEDWGPVFPQQINLPLI